MSLPISGFTAVPNPQMLSYMMSQSWIMMYAAGGAWQYGKRRISAMSNEEFNKLTPIALLQEHIQMLREAIPSIQASLKDMTPLIGTLMEQFGTFINEALKAIPQTVSNILGTPGGEFSNIPTSESVAGGTTGIGATQLGFLHYLKALADATAAGTRPPPDNSGASTIPGLTVFQAQAQALRKQQEFERLQKIQKDSQRKSSFTTSQITDIKASRQTVTAPTSTFGTIGTKKKAGQSQIMARKEFIGKIANSAHNMRQAVNPDQYKRHQGIMEMWQQKLVNLLARYTF